MLNMRGHSTNVASKDDGTCLYNGSIYKTIIIILFLECNQLYTGRIVIDLGTITTGVVPYIVQV